MKQYQVVSIERGKKRCEYGYLYFVTIHDRHARYEPIFKYSYYMNNKKSLVKVLRESGMEVSDHVKNGGKLRLY